MNGENDKKTAGERLVSTMMKAFKEELDKEGVAPYKLWRTYAPHVSTMPTFRRVLLGEGNINLCVAANIADALGYELKLVKKSK